MITRRIQSTPEMFTTGKLQFFLKKSIYRYLIAAALLGVAVPMESYSRFSSIVVYFIAILVVVLPIIYLSALYHSKSVDFDAEVSFGINDIRVKHNNKDLEETKDWGWIRHILIQKDVIFLELKEETPFIVDIPKNKLTLEEIAFFKSKSK